MIEITIVLVVVGIVCVGAFLCCRHEAKNWNKGICVENNLPWILQDRDSQGGRLYRAGEETTWISWPVDK